MVFLVLVGPCSFYTVPEFLGSKGLGYCVAVAKCSFNGPIELIKTLPLILMATLECLQLLSFYCRYRHTPPGMSSCHLITDPTTPTHLVCGKSLQNYFSAWSFQTKVSGPSAMCDPRKKS